MSLSCSLGSTDADVVCFVDMVLGRRDGGRRPQEGGRHAEVALIDANVAVAGMADGSSCLAIAVQLEWEGFR